MEGDMNPYFFQEQGRSQYPPITRENARGDMDGPYFFQERDRSHYPPITQEDADKFALGSYYADQDTRYFDEAMVEDTYRPFTYAYDHHVQPNFAPQYANQFEEHPSTTGISSPCILSRYYDEDENVEIKQEVVEDEPVRFISAAANDDDDAEGEVED
ncbi:hypothetical protein DSL72_002147 [Monilinia vaccinii-corymbosi]|uniref:Uncharacterized protein n=1 Tax=Monilinia vaccinii-corymbosi TaxID=61207 RepID=A0A8A3PBU9_9HELO|nr:hypothetical protein DSL72_002147 [Monilinia vaccinii-corymbosi]